MLITITRTLTVDAGTPTSALPELDSITLTTASPGAAFIGVYREFAAIAATVPMWLEGAMFPAPDGLPWSERGVTPPETDTAAGRGASYEAACSKTAWLHQLPDSRYSLDAQTVDPEPGFGITWTLEVLA